MEKLPRFQTLGLTLVINFDERAVHDAEHPAARGLRFIADNRNFFTDKEIKQGRFSNIWPTNNGDKT